MMKQGSCLKKFVNTLITLFLMFGFRFLPPFSTVTPVGMGVLGVFLGVIWGYTTCDIIWPSLFAFLAFGTSGYCTMTEAITSMMGHPIVFQSIMGFISAGALIHYGFGKWFIRWSLSKKIFKGDPLLYTWCFITFFGISAIIINQIQLQILLYSIWIEIARSCGYEMDSDFYYFGMGGILLGTISGGAMIPYYSWQLGFAEDWAKASGTMVNFAFMGIVSLALTVIITTVYIFAGKKVFHVDFNTLKYFDVEKLGEESKKLNHRTIRILAVYLVTVILIILGNTLPSGTFLNTIMNSRLTVSGAYCACAAILLILPSGEGDGKPCVEFDLIKDEAIQWGAIFICAVTLPVAAAVTDDRCGIVPWLSSLVSPALAGRSGLFVLVILIVVTFLLVNVGSNIAIGATMIPIAAPFVLASGLNVQLAGMALIYIINIGMLLPGVSAPAAIFHSSSCLGNAHKRMKAAALGCVCVLSSTVIVYMLLNLFLS